jgi:hypothetical protein
MFPKKCEVPSASSKMGRDDSYDARLAWLFRHQLQNMPQNIQSLFENQPSAETKHSSKFIWW